MTDPQTGIARRGLRVAHSRAWRQARRKSTSISAFRYRQFASPTLRATLSIKEAEAPRPGPSDVPVVRTDLGSRVCRFCVDAAVTLSAAA